MTIDLLEHALAIDPQIVDTQVLLATALIGRSLEQMSNSAEKDMERAERIIEEVLTVWPDHAGAHFAKGQLLRWRGRYDAAIPEYELAVAANRNWVGAIAALGLCKFLAGDLDEAIPAQELAIRLSPRDSRLPNWYWRIGMVYLLLSRIAEAILWTERARTANPQAAGPHAWLASAYALRGDMQGAAAELAEARRLSHDDRYANVAYYRSLFSAPNRERAEATIISGLRLAGVPD